MPEQNNPSEQDVQNVQTQIQEQEALLAKEQERLANLEKAVAEASSKANVLLEDLRDVRDVSKTAKTLSDKEEEPEQPTNPNTQSVEDQQSNPAMDEIQLLKKDVREKAFKQFFEQNPEFAQDSAKVERLIDRYGKIRSSNEFNTESVSQDILSAYYSIEGPNLVKQQANSNFQQSQIVAGSRSFGSQSVQPSGKDTLTNEDIQAMNQMAHLGFNAEKVLKLKQKGYIK